MFKDLISLIRELANLIRKHLSGSTDLTVLDTVEGNYGVMELIELPISGGINWNVLPKFHDRASMDEMVGVWKINHQYSRSYLFVIVLNIAALRQTVSKYNSNDPLRRSIEKVARNQLVLQKNIKGTHLVLYFWVSKARNIKKVRNGKVEHYPTIECQQAIVCDLQGMTNAWTGTNKPAAIVVYNCFLQIFKDPRFWILDNSGILWEDKVKNTNFIELLDNMAKRTISKRHILQPT